MADKVRVNGNVLSWGSITLKLDGERYSGFTAVTYGDKRERTAVYGMGKHHAPRGRTRGKYSTEPGKITGPKASVQAFIAALAAKSADGRSFGDVEFEAVVQGVEADETPFTHVLERCVVDGITSSHEEGSEELKDEISISYLKVRRNGLYLFDASGGLP